MQAKKPHPVHALALAMSLAASASGALAQTQAQPKLDTVTLGAGMYNIKAEVARTEEQRELGLMLRTEMGNYEGMLFVFDESAVHCFWMKNTILPLTAAFITDDGTVATLADMKPQTTESHCPSKPTRYVLEMNQGWFAKRGLHEGMKFTGDMFRK